jgi:uncharacterized protein (DUF58 family)
MISKNWEKLVTKYLIKKSNLHKNKLNKKNLYIFPNSNGFKLGAFIFFSFAAAIFYQNNVGLLISIILFFIYFLSIIISYQNLNNIKIDPLTTLVPQNKNVYLDYLIHSLNNRERLNLNISNNENNIKNVDLLDQKKITFKNLFLKRGVYEVPILKLESFFPFGIIKTYGLVKFEQKLHIYPEPIRPSQDLIKNLLIINKLDENDYEFDRIEEAKQGESLSRVSWRHYSIKNKLFTKKFTNSENNKEILIDIDLLNKKNLEKALSNAVYLIEYYFNKKINFALKYKQFTSKYSNSLTHKNDLLKFTANV